MTYGTKLRERIAGPGTTPLIGVYDMYSASIAANHYDGMFVSGFGFAASYYGLPDIGFIAWPDMVAFVQRLRGAFPHHHLLVDIDDGYVDPEVACHVVEGLERIGASGVILEDQKRPRRCGHADGKQVLPLDEYLEKLDRVLATRQDLVVVARTDATDEHDILH
ncbi:isocitrate lyase/phosphoenolpyruvate mutase family protein, partial [Streptomyces sp. NPDC059468]